MGDLYLIVIFAIIYYIIIASFIISIPIFSIIMYRKMRINMARSEKTILSSFLIFINIFLLAGTYFFILKDWIL